MSKRLLVRDQQGERERLLVGTMTVGRDTRCDISDADPLLSRRHAEFVCRPDSLRVRDLNSRNGISVNGVKVHEAVLRPGDVVRIARLVMTYLGDLEAARASSSSSPTIDMPRQQASLRADDTERVRSPGPPSADAPSSEDDRTRMMPPRSEQRTPIPGQVAVARMTPSAPRPSAPPAVAPPPEDQDRTLPMVRQEDVKTNIPVLPRSATPATTRAPAAPARRVPPVVERVAPPPPPAPPPIAAPPPPALTLDDWSLELRPRPVDALPPPAPVAALTPHDGRVLVASVGLALLVFTLTAVPMIVWLTFRREVPAALWNFIVVLGPVLLCSLAAGLGVARWLRRR